MKKKIFLIVTSVLAIASVCLVPAFATEDTSFAITSSMLAPITSAVNSGLTTIVPVGIGIMAIILGIGLIPKIIKRFTR